MTDHLVDTNNMVTSRHKIGLMKGKTMPNHRSITATDPDGTTVELDVYVDPNDFDTPVHAWDKSRTDKTGDPDWTASSWNDLKLQIEALDGWTIIETLT